MKTIALGTTEIQVTRLSYGAMRIAVDRNPATLDKESIERGIKSLEAAVDAGYNFIDHADIYGGHACEMIHGYALDRHPDWRDRLVVATKFAVRGDGDPDPKSPGRFDTTADYIRKSIDGSLQRLKLDRIDLYQIHRPDWLLDPEEVAAAFIEIHQAGKVRYFGVSNFRPTLLSALQSALPFPIVSNQVEVHLLRLDHFDDGTLDQCLEKKMSPLAWSPFCGGELAIAIDPDAPLPKDPRRAYVAVRLRPVLADVANAYNTTPLAIILAWLMRHPSRMIPIYGSVRPEKIREAAKADEITLDRESWYRIWHAARA
jgi:predicted oxidoreductase